MGPGEEAYGLFWTSSLSSCNKNILVKCDHIELVILTIDKMSIEEYSFEMYTSSKNEIITN